MKNCFLDGNGSCGGKITGEHYISRSVLEAIDPSGKSQIGGLPWQPDQTLQLIGNSSLVSNILCEKHNSNLSPLDATAARLFRLLDAVDKRPNAVAPISRVDGPNIERWFLKVICGLSAGVGLNNKFVPNSWKEILVGNPWPEHWGLYVPYPSGTQVLATEFAVETLVNPGTSEVKAVKFRVAGVHFNLLLAKPDHPEAWGVYRPRGLIFQDSIEKRIGLVWPVVTGEAVIYRKVGAPTAVVPQWEGWKK